MENGNEKFGFFTSGLILGGIIGSVLGILYAPDSGKRTRKKIQRKSDELVDDVVKYAHQSRDRAEEIVEDGRKRVEELMEEAKSTLKK
ncbi:MAG: YtxH domain-containing protein [Melioribacteraceae bacterium]|nr:YtxH domain-containing protein [Melioribacteraceae bacterium]